MKSNDKPVASGILLILIFFLLPRLILGMDSYIRIHDNLDGAIGRSVDIIMGGNYENFFGFALNFISFLKFIFEPYMAYIINDVIVHLVAFIGLFLLLQKHILPDKENSLIIFGTSLCFSFLPFYSNFGLSIAGMPLLFYAFQNLRNQTESIYDYFIIVIFPFYSFLALSGIFIVVIFGLLFFVDLIRNREINRQFFLGLVILGALYSLVEFNLIYTMFFSKSFISHRAAWEPLSTLLVKTFPQSITLLIKNIIAGHYHAASLHGPVLLLSIILIVAIHNKKQLKPIIVLLSIIILFSAFFSIYTWDTYALLREKIQIFRTFNFGRFHWFHPMLWYILFAYCLTNIKKFKFSRISIPLIIMVQLVYVVLSPFGAKQELKYNIIGLFQKVEYTSNRMSFREFYSEELFKKIDNYIGDNKNTYRIGCIGFHPSIAQYNGFITLDAYMTNYPLEYKNRFRKIIAGELEKNPINRMYFDDWGNRCYFFIHNLNRHKVNNIKTSKLKETELNFDIKAFKEMDGKYFFSTVKITNADKIFLKYLKTFEMADLPWRIYLYQVNM
ncbi:MAG: hypothetical protein CVV49_02660 [Spirochaetae bacterium HGW-Spirochaetae-5]|jgi:hypothetical protein|nr:MAG: hypothetical protein CVV49_02660 [Spirochaetae bacterium HGW-Spirochaetae-5]